MDEYGAATQNLHVHPCVIVRWMDGDSATLDVDLDFRITFRQILRVYGINAPELHSPDPIVRKAAKDALDYAKLLAPEGGKYLIKSYKDFTDKFGRWLASIMLANGNDFAAEMISAGHAVEYRP